ncbi:helix-turn-helix transcriptional regulator [Streptomyces sp. Ru87]|uniref:helix-turn-helix domain-containing protein n=1 Tax=Streptomyces sp. Ru87 TaxID=2044307 RepID=UPI000BF6A1BB|nr:helix-turn-helix transcriptional regulator [Streptomyces sp. Ru87]PGH49460.1 transcriptional regulator [Streptomyces sp. Ru87]
MPPRSNPTARQERLGAELRKLREGAGITARSAARAIGMDQAKMSHLEAGRVAVGGERVRTLSAHYGVTDGVLVEALATMADERVRGWWNAYRDVLPQSFLDLAELEHHATYVNSIEITQAPGLLQTEEYARALFTYMDPGRSQADLSARVEHRLRRQDVLDRTPRLAVEMVIHEAALRICVADRAVARAQLERFLEESERDNVAIRVIPFRAEGFGSPGYSMTYVGGSVPRLDTVQVDAVHAGVLLDDAAQLRTHRDLYAKVRDLALAPAESRDLISEVRQQM